MRPQHITAENRAPRRAAGAAARRASMRPQHITAENVRAGHAHQHGDGCFNEAAAYHCGKPATDGLAAPDQRASMRPQHITAENMPVIPQTAAAVGASMRPQHITAENMNYERLIIHNCGCFNEAAAYHCGKPVVGVESNETVETASMRPQHITAENLSSMVSRIPCRCASMRPQHITAENSFHRVV